MSTIDGSSALTFFDTVVRPSVVLGTGDQREFQDVLGVARASSRTAPAGADATEEERAAIDEQRAKESREAAEMMIARLFIEPVLASAREHSQAAPPFAPTDAEKQFGALTDAKLALNVVKAARLPIVDRLARDLLL